MIKVFMDRNVDFKKSMTDFITMAVYVDTDDMITHTIEMIVVNNQCTSRFDGADEAYSTVLYRYYKTLGDWARNKVEGDDAETDLELCRKDFRTAVNAALKYAEEMRKEKQREDLFRRY